ncbi:MAG: class I SAM-dependent methyltransferase [Saprospiraceae bacterium]|nr:class I SAM-dependent methyltransferase [Saprospiraceae bacterium]
MSTRATLYNYAQGDQHQGQPVANIFQRIHDSNEWNVITTESVSGEGSTMEQTEVLRAELPGLLKKLGVRTLLDLPCGDFNWMQHVDLTGIRYLGGDIVAALVERNNAQFGNENRQFLHLNLLTDPLPACDLLFCRDCLVHLSFADVQAALANIRRSGITYLVTTHFHDEPENTDILTGGWRPLNLFKAPFHFPEPVAEINEQCSEMDGAFADKCAVVWRVSDI